MINQKGINQLWGLVTGTLIAGVGGVSAMGGEFLFKKLPLSNGNKRVSTIFFQTIQTSTAAALLFLIGSPRLTPMNPKLLAFAGTIFAITPLVNAIAEKYKCNNVTSFTSRANSVVNCAAKFINVAALTAIVYLMSESSLARRINRPQNF